MKEVTNSVRLNKIRGTELHERKALNTFVSHFVAAGQVAIIYMLDSIR